MPLHIPAAALFRTFPDAAVIFVGRDPVPSTASGLSLMRAAHAALYRNAWLALSAVEKAWMAHLMAFARAEQAAALVDSLQRYAFPAPGRSGSVHCVGYEAITRSGSRDAALCELLAHVRARAGAHAHMLRASAAAARKQARRPYVRRHRVRTLDELGVQRVEELVAMFRPLTRFVERLEERHDPLRVYE